MLMAAPVLLSDVLEPHGLCRILSIKLRKYMKGEGALEGQDTVTPTPTLQVPLQKPPGVTPTPAMHYSVRAWL